MNKMKTKQNKKKQNVFIGEAILIIVLAVSLLDNYLQNKEHIHINTNNIFISVCRKE